MKKKLFYSFLLLFFIACSGKSKIVEAQIEGLNEKDSVILAYYLGEKLYPKDTIFPDKNGKITYKKWEKAEPGMYAFVVNTQDSSKATLVDFILNEEKKIVFKTTAGNNQSVPNMQVESSEENKIHQSTKRKNGCLRSSKTGSFCRPRANRRTNESH